MLLFLSDMQDYINEVDKKFKDILVQSQFVDKQRFLDMHDEFLDTHFTQKIHSYSFTDHSSRQNETQYELIQRWISEFGLSHEKYINEVVIECENAIYYDKKLNAGDKDSTMIKLNRFKVELVDKLKPASYCEHSLKENELDRIANEKFNEAIDTLNTNVVADFLVYPSLSHQEVLAMLTDECRNRCIKYCTQEYTNQYNREYIFMSLYADMSDAVQHVIECLSSNIEVAFRERCIINDVFNRLAQVKKNLAKAAIVQCWNEVSLDYIDDMYGEDAADDFAHVVYKTVLAK